MVECSFVVPGVASLGEHSGLVRPEHAFDTLVVAQHVSRHLPGGVDSVCHVHVLSPDENSVATRLSPIPLAPLEALRACSVKSILKDFRVTIESESFHAQLEDANDLVEKKQTQELLLEMCLDELLALPCTTHQARALYRLTELSNKTALSSPVDC